MSSALIRKILFKLDDAVARMRKSPEANQATSAVAGVANAFRKLLEADFFQKYVLLIFLGAVVFSACSSQECKSIDTDFDLTEKVKQITFEKFQKRTGFSDIDKFQEESLVQRSRVDLSLTPGAKSAYEVYFVYEDFEEDSRNYLRVMIYLDKCNQYFDHSSNQISKQNYINVKQSIIEWKG